jgi:putative SOS response-associated peptidase YedK
MCYHYSIAKTANEIADRYKVSQRPPRINPDPVSYHVNGFEHRLLPVVYQDYNHNELKLEFMQWGLVPGWVKGEGQAMKLRSGTLNARAETVDSRPSFRAAFKYRPCLVAATGYFEWMHHQGKKFPFLIYIPDKQIFSIAGIWDEWVNEHTGEILRSFSIITCKANSLAARIHNLKQRMPVILDSDIENKWLDNQAGETTRKNLLKPFDSSRMGSCTVSRRITDRNHDSNVPEVLEPFQYPELSQA